MVMFPAPYDIWRVSMNKSAQKIIFLSTTIIIFHKYCFRQSYYGCGRETMFIIFFYYIFLPYVDLTKNPYG